jgi:hypothetical protein
MQKHLERIYANELNAMRLVYILEALTTVAFTVLRMLNSTLSNSYTMFSYFASGAICFLALWLFASTYIIKSGHLKNMYCLLILSGAKMSILTADIGFILISGARQAILDEILFEVALVIFYLSRYCSLREIKRRIYEVSQSSYDGGQ